MVFISEFLIGFPSIIWLSIVLTSLVMYTWITRCTLKTEFRDGRQRSKPKFYFVFRIQVSSPRFFLVKLSISTSYWVIQYERESYGGYLMIKKYMREIVLCHSDWIKIMRHVIHYLLCYLCANTYIAKVSDRILSLQ